MRLIKKLKKEFLTSTFFKYALVGLFTYIIGTIITTVFLYIGRERFFISILILNPIIKVVDWLFGFVFKWIMYKKLKIKF